MRLVYFARIREQLGCDEEELALPFGVVTLAELIDWLAQRGEPWRSVLTAPDLICALNQEVVGLEAALSANDEVAFFPPVTGG